MVSTKVGPKYKFWTLVHPCPYLFLPLSPLSFSLFSYLSPLSSIFLPLLLSSSLFFYLPPSSSIFPSLPWCVNLFSVQLKPSRTIIKPLGLYFKGKITHTKIHLNLRKCRFYNYFAKFWQKSENAS